MCVDELLLSSTDCLITLKTGCPFVQDCGPEPAQPVRVTCSSCRGNGLRITEATSTSRVHLSIRAGSRIGDELDRYLVAQRIDCLPDCSGYLVTLCCYGRSCGCGCRSGCSTDRRACRAFSSGDDAAKTERTKPERIGVAYPSNSIRPESADLSPVPVTAPGATLVGDPQPEERLP